MSAENQSLPPQPEVPDHHGWTLLVLIAIILLPLATWFLLPLVPPLGSLPDLYSGGTSYPASELHFERNREDLLPVKMDPPSKDLPLITNVQILDFDGDGKNEILACDAADNRILLISVDAEGGQTTRTLIDDVAAPAHATAVDIDADGDLDLAVSILGNIQPDDGVVGKVELFEQTDNGFVRHVILDDVRRVADVQPGDFDQDGDLDLAVAVFGYNRGEVLWLENQGDFQFFEHQLYQAPGTIHVPVADYDGDGDLDIATIVSQEEEELVAFENLGQGKFRTRSLWMTPNMDLGSAGLIHADLDQDGDEDLILPAGDNLEDFDAYPQPYHGCYWFENQGNWEFEQRRISDLGGTYAGDVADLDGDGDLDVVLVSMTNDWYAPEHASLVWLENDGQQNFTSWQIDSEPIHLVTVAAGDLDQDGLPDIAAGSLNMRKPFDRIGRVTVWLQRPEEGR
ncbi:FG-GAP repeat protein [Gimesia panareensis]|uniref:FG-GAP repeat protein n=1 Tax=Gimesia panareensis TaxID=2527978 RepID=A0A518FGT2_9PLAN|nr:VCBS repeat-containing protein [Gimesia panareensis]QDV15510.1 FG-GAP repeat protein [Gimesia panareensis]